MYKIFVIIVSYNGKQWYERCFGSLRMSSIPLNVIVVDNSSSDDTVSYIKENYPEIVLIESEVNLGFGQANNKGIRFALDYQADYVFLLNQDAWVEPTTIEKLIHIHEINKNLGILSPIHLNAEKSQIEKGLANHILNSSNMAPDFLNDLFFNRPLSDFYKTKYINAAAWLLPRKTLDEVGGFDPIFFHYGEDDNYMQRVLFHGYDIGVCPKTYICHDTERRVIKKEFIEFDYKKCLLIEYTNINYKVNVQAFLKSTLIKMITKVMRLDYTRAKRLWSEFKFIYLNKKRIFISRSTNIKKTQSWL